MGLLNTVKGNFIALQYKTRIVDESLGVYDIEVTNYVDTNTFKERTKVVPSLMSMAQQQKIQAGRARRLMIEQNPKANLAQRYPQPSARSSLLALN